MKKTLLLFLAMAGCIATAAAQDMIIKRDASRIEARVTEISPAEVRYKRFSNPDGPTYVLPVSEIAAIRYANGEEERFAEVAKAAAPQPPADVRYAVGDYYERDGVQGIVVEIDEEGRHGKILSLDQAMLPWTLFRKPDLRTVGTDDQGDGRVNMATMERYIEANGLSWSDFPAFEWCRNKGEGWYLPAINEMLIVGSSYHGGVRSHSATTSTRPSVRTAASAWTACSTILLRPRRTTGRPGPATWNSKRPTWSKSRSTTNSWCEPCAGSDGRRTEDKR